MSTQASRMTMRAEVRRSTAAADAHGGAGVPAWTSIHDAAPCFAWSKVRQRVVDGRINAEVEEFAVLFRAGADVRAHDRVEDIKDRRGRVLYAGPFEVITGTEKSSGPGIGHLAFKLRRIA